MSDDRIHAKVEGDDLVLRQYYGQGEGSYFRIEGAANTTRAALLHKVDVARRSLAERAAGRPTIGWDTAEAQTLTDYLEEKTT